METKPLLYGLIGFFLGGLLVSVAATNLSKPANMTQDIHENQMIEELRGKHGDKYDQAFLSSMIEHHQSAITMAELSERYAKHDEIKKLSHEIVMTQQSEIEKMKQWQRTWNYARDGHTHHK